MKILERLTLQLRSRRIWNKLLVLGLAMVVSHCATTYKSSMLDQSQEAGWTRPQRYGAYHYSFRIKMMTPNDKGGYDINYRILPVEMAANIIKVRLEDLDLILDYNVYYWASYIKTFGLREHFERQEEIAKAQYAYLHLYEQYQKFKDYMGDRSNWQPRELNYGYDPPKIFVQDVMGAFPFTSVMVEEARQRGTLKEVERFVWSAKKMLGEKTPDPNDPDDANKFLWKPLEAGVEFVSYKIIGPEMPKDSGVDYIEGTRLVMTNGQAKRESGPALKLFVATNGWGSVLTIDQDREGEIGNMLPDFVERVTRVSSAESLMNQSVLSRLFKEPDKQRRIPPKDPPPITVEIARVGTPVDLWEKNDKGWTVPLRYKNERNDNYQVTTKIKGSEHARYDQSDPNKQIEYFRKDWESAGNVQEYFRPRPPFDGANVVRASAQGRMVVIETNVGDVIQGVITSGPNNKFIQDQPYEIDFSEGQMRWKIKDDDGDGKYEKRRLMSN